MTTAKKPDHYDNNWLGVMNAFTLCSVRWNNRTVTYNGTTLDLVKSLLAAGAVDGDTFTDERDRTRRFHAAPWDTRANGFWVTEWNVSY